MAKMKLYTSAQLESKIADLHTKGQKLQTEMHKIACSVIQHVGMHKDARAVQTMVGKLLMAMPEMSRKNALMAWFEAFAPVKFGEGDTVTYVKTKDVKLGLAMEKPFWKFVQSEGKPYEAVDINKLIADTVKRLEKDATKTNRDHSALITAMKAQRVQPVLTAPAPTSDPLAS